MTDIDTLGNIVPRLTFTNTKALAVSREGGGYFPPPRPLFPQWERSLGPLPKSPVVKSPSVPNYNPSSRFMALFQEPLRQE